MTFCFTWQLLKTNTHRTALPITAHIFIDVCTSIVNLNFHFILFWVKWNTNTYESRRQNCCGCYIGESSYFQLIQLELHNLYFTATDYRNSLTPVINDVDTTKSKPLLCRRFPCKSLKINKTYEWIMMFAFCSHSNPNAMQIFLAV